MNPALLPRHIALLAVLGGGLACSSDIAVGKLDAEVTVTPDFADLGLHPVGTTLETVLTLSARDGDVNVLAVDVFNVEGDAFSLLTSPLPTIPSSGTADLVLQWSPLEPGRTWTEVTIVHQVGEELVVLRGEAGQPAARVVPEAIDFGRVPVGSTGTATIRIDNLGTLDLDITEALFDESSFSTTATLPLVVPPGDSVSLDVVFTPTDDSATRGEATLQLGDFLDAGEVKLYGNDCAFGGGGNFDLDNDGFSWCSTDCNDDAPDTHPGAAEVCDDEDNDCDGQTDEGTSCADDDGDGYSENEGDCNDGNDAISPDAVEDYANGVDDDCDNIVDYGEIDVDGDGILASAGDCNETNASIHPGAPEIPNGIDDDCDGITDEGTIAYDDDGDGYTEVLGDCDDTSPTVHPLAVEVADWIDQDCDGIVDEGTTAYDDDGDGFTEIGGDCNDANAAISPAAIEIRGNGINDDCDSSTPD